MRAISIIWSLIGSALLLVLPMADAQAQPAGVADPITAAQAGAVWRGALPTIVGSVPAGGADPIQIAQILAAAEKTFPNLADDLGNAKLFQRVADDQTMRCNLRGRIAEDDWITRNAKDGWKPVQKRNLGLFTKPSLISLRESIPLRI
jgi:hypothetical protein